MFCLLPWGICRDQVNQFLVWAQEANTGLTGDLINAREGKNSLLGKFHSTWLQTILPEWIRWIGLSERFSLCNDDGYGFSGIHHLLWFATPVRLLQRKGSFFCKICGFSPTMILLLFLLVLVLTICQVMVAIIYSFPSAVLNFCLHSSFPPFLLDKTEILWLSLVFSMCWSGQLLRLSFSLHCTTYLRVFVCFLKSTQLQYCLFFFLFLGVFV